MKKSPTEEYAYDAVMELLEQKEREILDRLVLGGLTAVIEPRDGQNSGASDEAPSEAEWPVRLNL
jgi:hypothetical protein